MCRKILKNASFHSAKIGGKSIFTYIYGYTNRHIESIKNVKSE